MESDDCTTLKCFGAMVSVLDKPALLLGRGGQILRASDLLNHQVGQFAGGLIGRQFADLLSLQNQEKFTDFHGRSAADGGDKASRFRCSLQLNSRKFAVSVAPLTDGGHTLGYLCQAHVQSAGGETRLQYLMQHLDQGVWDYDINAKVLVVSQTWRKMRGMGPDEAPKLPGGDWLAQVHPDDRAMMQDVLDVQKSEGGAINVQYRYRHAQGHWVWIMSAAKVAQVDAQGRATRIVGTDTDVTEAKQNEAKNAQLAEKLRLAVDASGIGVWEFDPNNKTVHWDNKMLEIYGLTDGQNDRSHEVWETYLHPDDVEDMVAYADHCQKHGLDFSRDYRVVRPCGEIRHIRSRASQVAVPGSLPKLVGVNIDVTEDYRRTKELERVKAQLEYDSRHDALTGLANRRCLDETTAAFFDKVGHQHSYAVLHLDLDHFKEVNDTFGHAAGDAVLIYVAGTIQEIIGDSGLVCRIGGDEFAVFFEVAPTAAKLHEICSDVVDALKQPIIYQGSRCSIGISIGCALGHGPIDNHVEIFIKADSALYAAKEAGRNCYRLHPTAA